MGFIIKFLESVVLLASAFVGLALLANFYPLGGVGAALALGVLAIVVLFRPLPSFWLGIRFVNGLLLAISALALVISLQMVAQQRTTQEAARKLENEKRLVELRISNPVAYLSELKAAKDPHWESEFETLDKVGYDKYVADRHAKEEQGRKKSIAQYLEQLKSTSVSDTEGLYNIYYHLSVLDPSTRDYQTKREALSKQIEEKNKLAEAQRNPLPYVKLEKFSWSKDGFGNVMIASFSIKNTLPWPIKDITIKCTHSAPSGTTIDQNTRTIFERIEANKTKYIVRFNMGFINSQASRSGCEIINVVSIR